MNGTCRGCCNSTCMVETAGSGEAALELVKQKPVDLILIDLVMPGLDGFATVRELRKHPESSQIPVIMLTSRGQGLYKETSGRSWDFDLSYKTL